MRKAAGFFAVLLVILVLCTPGLPRVAEISPGRPVLGLGDWPDEVRELVNCHGRVYGYFFNAVARLFFAGDADDFNWFLGTYAGLKDTPKRLILHRGPGKTKRFGRNEEIAFDWQVSISPVVRRASAPEARPERVYVVTVGLWLGGQVELDKVNVITNVMVQTDEKAKTDEAIAKFIAAYERGREKAEATQRETEPAASSAASKESEPAKPAPVSSGDSVEAADPVVPRSKKPLFAKVALNEDGSRVLSVMHDESEGTGKGYDLLYADLNFDGKFEQGESSRKTHHPYMSRTRALPAGWEGWAFSPISLNVPFNDKGEGVPNPCKIILGFQRYRTMRSVPTLPTVGPPPSPMKIVEVFEVRSEIRLRQDSAVWDYSFEGNMKPSESLESAPVWSFDAKPKLEITTRPDGRKEGNLGIALSVPAGEKRFQCKKAGEPPKAHVEIKKLDGTVLHKGDETLDKFRFG